MSSPVKVRDLGNPSIRTLHLGWIAFFITFVMWFSHAPLMGHLKEAFDLVKPREPSVQRAINNPGATMSKGGFGPEVLAAAIHFCMTIEDADACLTASLEYAGPANFCPCLVGKQNGPIFSTLHCCTIN